MATYYKAVPKSVKQQHDESCWAAVLESWDHADSRMRLNADRMAVPDEFRTDNIEHDELCAAWGEGPTKKITPNKLENVAYACGLKWKVLNSPSNTGNLLEEYLVLHLGGSYIFCAVTMRPDEMHAVLIYGMRDGGAVYMDPSDGGNYWCNWNWFHNRRKLIVMRRPQ